MNIKIILVALVSLLLITGCTHRVKYTPSLNIDKEIAKQNIRELIFLQYVPYEITNVLINDKELKFTRQERYKKVDYILIFKDIKKIRFLSNRGRSSIRLYQTNKNREFEFYYNNLERAKSMVNALAVMEKHAKPKVKVYQY